MLNGLVGKILCFVWKNKLWKLDCRWPRERSWRIWTSLSLQDVGILQFGGTSQTSLSSWWLLPGHKSSGEHWAQQEGKSLFTKLFWVMTDWHRLTRHCICLTEHVFPCAWVPDNHLLLRWFCLPDDEALPGCYTSLCQHPSLHPKDEKHVSEVHI